MRTVEVDGMGIGDGHPPRIMSVLNMSPKSGFTDSVELRAERAAEMVDEELVPEGGEIIDVGLQSANPVYETEPEEVELERLEEAARVLDYVESDTIFSIETRYASVAEEAIGYGFDIVNDVGGFADPEMKGVCEDHDVPVVKMASPPDVTRVGELKTIDDVFEALQRDGFTDKTIIDPAFGDFGDRTYEDNWEMLRRLEEFRAFGRPILTATNREDFLGDLAGRHETDEQLAVSLASATIEVMRGAHVIRTHDTRTTRDVAQVAHALRDERSSHRTDAEGGVTVTELPGVSPREAGRHFSIRESVAGGPEDGATLAFQVTDLPAELLDPIATASEDAGLALADGDEDLFLAGDVASLRRFLDELPTHADALTELAGTVRLAVSRRTD